MCTNSPFSAHRWSALTVLMQQILRHANIIKNPFKPKIDFKKSDFLNHDFSNPEFTVLFGPVPVFWRPSKGRKERGIEGREKWREFFLQFSSHFTSSGFHVVWGRLSWDNFPGGAIWAKPMESWLHFCMPTIFYDFLHKINICNLTDLCRTSPRKLELLHTGNFGNTGKF